LRWSILLAVILVGVKPRGKFAGKPILVPKILEQRKYVDMLYACIWLAVATNLVLAFTGPRDGLLP
jgi:hypothetical protein